MEVLTRAITPEKEMKGKKKKNERHPNWKKEVKLSLFTADIILYVESLKESTKKLLELINDGSKSERYKISINISCIYIY